MATTYLNLDLPVVSTTIGPDYANKNNDAFTVIDEHDHSSGKGKQVPASGLNINSSLDFQENHVYNLSKVSLFSNAATLTGALNTNSIYTVQGNLWYTNSGGNAVQLTAGGSIVSSAGSLQTMEVQSVAGNVTIQPSDTFVLVFVDTNSGSHTITLPQASAVAEGRIYIFKDRSGNSNTNNIVIQAAGADDVEGGSTYSYDSNYGSFWLVGDGVSSWYLV